MPKLDEQISVLQTKLLQLKLRQQRIDARQRAVASVRERKQDTRRKILLGAVVLEKMRQHADDHRLISAWLETSLTRSSDRALFGLEPLQPTEEATAGVESHSQATRPA